MIGLLGDWIMDGSLHFLFVAIFSLKLVLKMKEQFLPEGIRQVLWVCPLIEAFLIVNSQQPPWMYCEVLDKCKYDTYSTRTLLD